MSDKVINTRTTMIFFQESIDDDNNCKPHLKHIIVFMLHDV